MERRWGWDGLGVGLLDVAKYRKRFRRSDDSAEERDGGR